LIKGRCCPYRDGLNIAFIGDFAHYKAVILFFGVENKPEGSDRIFTVKAMKWEELDFVGYLGGL